MREVTSIEELAPERDALAKKCREIAARGVAVGGAGNVSLRTGDYVLMTRRGLRLETATGHDISVVDAAGALLDGKQPTSEFGLHLAVYSRSSAGAVVHTHGRSSVAVGLTCDALPLVHYNQGRLGGEVPTLPYQVFGSHELASAVGDAVAGGSSTVLLRNHGSVSSAPTVEDAIEHAELLEWVCEVFIAASSLGRPSQLTEFDLRAVSEQARRLGYGTR